MVLDTATIHDRSHSWRRPFMVTHFHTFKQSVGLIHWFFLVIFVICCCVIKPAWKKICSSTVLIPWLIVQAENKRSSENRMTPRRLLYREFSSGNARCLKLFNICAVETSASLDMSMEYSDLQAPVKIEYIVIDICLQMSFMHRNAWTWTRSASKTGYEP